MPATKRSPQAAADLYVGDLRESIDDEWLVAERQRLYQRYLDALASLAEMAESGGDHEAAITQAERPGCAGSMKAPIHC